MTSPGRMPKQPTTLARQILARALILLAILLAGAGQTLACTTPTCCLVGLDCASDAPAIHATPCAGACIAAMPVAAVTRLANPLHLTYEPATLSLPTGRSIPPATPPPDRATQTPV